ncbi:MAG TPA: carboxypeptidase-like regulatory domain-containing protein [Thermoanaerobaculia bacterium]|nr:carboxypeptidase-like regulatory domain-containing protein [Thermoanaerobaculia bacterium]
MQKRLLVFFAVALALLAVSLPAAAQLVPSQALRVAAAFAPPAAEPGPAHSLEVELLLPEPLVESELRLIVRRQPSDALLASVPLPPQTFRHTFSRLPAAAVEVELVTPLGNVTRRVDLRQEADAYLLLEPDFIALWGTVTVDDEGHPSKLTLTTVDNGEVAVESDEEGSYEVALVRPLRAVQIEFLDSPLADHIEFFGQPIDTSRQFDFDLPGIRNLIEVVDAVTGEPVPNASVNISSRYQEYNERTGRDEEVANHRRVDTGDDGIVAWHAFKEGEIELMAMAEGYLPSPQPLRDTVLDSESRRTFRLPLEPLGETVALTVLRPDGTPAAGAEVLLYSDHGLSDLVYQVESDASGRASLPRRPPGAHLLVRHPETAFAIRPWAPAEGDETATISLPPVAPPLTVEVRTADGTAPARRVQITAWFGGYRLSGGALYLATRTRPHTDPNGFWVAEGLPAAPLSLLANELSVADEARAGQLDTLATEIPYPWPQPVVIHAVR